MENIMSEVTGQKPTDEEYKWSYNRTNSKGEKKFKHTTNQTIEEVTNYLDSKNIEYNLRLGGSMLWIYNSYGRAYAYYYTTGRWAKHKPSGYPDKHYSSKGIVDFVDRFLEESKESDQKLTKLCIDCDAELILNDNWTEARQRQAKYLCKPCWQQRDSLRMYVNGKHISKHHPLYKSGRYKGFTDAAFSSLSNYEIAQEGEVYIIYNPSFPSWIKVGMAVDSEDRLKQYQTGSPYRDRRKSEAEAHALLEENHERRGEWFVCSAVVAENILDNHFKGK